MLGANPNFTQVILPDLLDLLVKGSYFVTVKHSSLFLPEKPGEGYNPSVTYRYCSMNIVREHRRDCLSGMTLLHNWFTRFSCL
jgi:hypothetical protein